MGRRWLRRSPVRGDTMDDGIHEAMSSRAALFRRQGRRGLLFKQPPKGLLQVGSHGSCSGPELARALRFFVTGKTDQQVKPASRACACHVEQPLALGVFARLGQRVEVGKH